MQDLMPEVPTSGSKKEAPAPGEVPQKETSEVRAGLSQEVTADAVQDNNEKIEQLRQKLFEAMGVNSLEQARKRFPEEHYPSRLPSLVEFLDSEKYLEEILKLYALADYPGGGSFFAEAFPAIKEEFKDDKLRPDLLQIAGYTKENTKIFFAYTFPKIKEEFKEDKLRKDLLLMIKESGINSSILFATCYVRTIKDDLKQGGYERVKDYWADVIRLYNLQPGTFDTDMRGEKVLKFKATHKKYVETLLSLKAEGVTMANFPDPEILFNEEYLKRCRTEKRTFLYLQ